MQIVETNQLKTVIFTAVENPCMLHVCFRNAYVTKVYQESNMELDLPYYSLKYIFLTEKIK